MTHPTISPILPFFAFAMGEESNLIGGTIARVADQYGDAALRPGFEKGLTLVSAPGDAPRVRGPHGPLAHTITSPGPGEECGSRLILSVAAMDS